MFTGAAQGQDFAYSTSPIQRMHTAGGNTNGLSVLPTDLACMRAEMIPRREFLKNSAAAAAIFGIQGTGAFASHHPQAGLSARSRVVLADDPMLRDEFGEPISLRVDDLLDRAVFAYTGQPEPRKAWKAIVGKSPRIGIKVDGRSGKGLATHPMLVNAIAERLQNAGIPAEHILIWDATAADLEACGFTINTERGAVQCFGSDMAGYEDTPESWGTVQVRLSKILTRECDLVIDVPVLKDDRVSGVSFAMENMSGAALWSSDLKSLGRTPAFADLNCIPTVRNKVRFTVGDALSGIYDGGPAFNFERLWHPNSLIVSRDCVAVDQIAWQLIDQRRAKAGLKSLAAVGRAPEYIAVAADAQHSLGTNDSQKIDLQRI